MAVPWYYRGTRVILSMGYWQPILKKLMHLRYWSDDAGFKTEAQKFFNARTMHTTCRHQEDDLGNAF